MPHKDTAKRAEYQRQYRQLNKARKALQRPMHDRVRHANQRAAKYGCSDRLTLAEVRSVMQVGRCAYCGGTDRLGIDHVIPLHAGGPNTTDNVVCCCHSCNSRKYRKESVTAWSGNASACIECGQTDSKHRSRGVCNRCYVRRVHADRRAQHERGSISAVGY